MKTFHVNAMWGRLSTCGRLSIGLLTSLRTRIQVNGIGRGGVQLVDKSVARPEFHFGRSPRRTSLASCLVGLFLFAATAQAQLTNVSINPASGSSASGVIQAFTANFDDTLGYTDIPNAHFLVATSPWGSGNCSVLGIPSANALYLANDSGTAMLGPVTAGSGNTVQNSQCTVYGTGVRSPVLAPS